MTVAELTEKLIEDYNLEKVDFEDYMEPSKNHVIFASMRYAKGEQAEAFFSVRSVMKALGTASLHVIINKRDFHVKNAPYVNVTKTVNFSKTSEAYDFLVQELDAYKEEIAVWNSNTCTCMESNLQGNRRMMLAILDTDFSNHFQNLDVTFKGDTYTLDDMLQVASQTFIDTCKAFAKEGKLTDIDEVCKYLKKHWYNREFKETCSEDFSES